MTDHAVAIECRDVGLLFPGAAGESTLALSGVSCSFLPGKVTAIIGPSGCGKSTLLQIVRGFLDPSRGHLNFVKLEGGVAAQRPAMSTVWQAFNLFPWLTVLENVAFGLELAGVPKAEREAPLPRWICRASKRSIRANCPAACASASALRGLW
jgi:NitT/TauT family transport system ATP-binding protein